MIVTATVCTAAHTNYPSRVRHLIIHLSQCWRHLVGQCARHNHNIALPWTRAEDYAQTILVVARRGEMHHFDGAAGEAEGHGPEGALTRPVGDLVESCERVLHGAFLGFLRREGHFTADAACDGETGRVVGGRRFEGGGGFGGRR